MLVDKRSGYSEPPSNRYNIDGFYSEKSKVGTLGLKGGYFISDQYQFDPPFFGITQTEAVAMDPQQRKLLECVYEALESGGIPLDSVSGKNVGTYVGNFTYDYAIMALRDMEYPKPYSMTGHGATILSNRVSYVFNLCGPRFVPAHLEPQYLVGMLTSPQFHDRHCLLVFAVRRPHGVPWTRERRSQWSRGRWYQHDPGCGSPDVS